MVVRMPKWESVPLKMRGVSVPIRRLLTRGADGKYFVSDADASNYKADVHIAKRSYRDLPTPGQIRAFLRHFRLSQRRASQMFGGGERSFQKYVKGTQIPSEAMSRLLRLVWRHPELIADLESPPRWWDKKKKAPEV